MTIPALFERHPRPWHCGPSDSGGYATVTDANGRILLGGYLPVAIARLLAAAPGLVEENERLKKELATAMDAGRTLDAEAERFLDIANTLEQALEKIADHEAEMPNHEREEALAYNETKAIARAALAALKEEA